MSEMNDDLLEALAAINVCCLRTEQGEISLSYNGRHLGDVREREAWSIVSMLRHVREDFGPTEWFTELFGPNWTVTRSARYPNRVSPADFSVWPSAFGGTARR